MSAEPDASTPGTASTSSGPILERVDVGKSYGNVHALRGVTLVVRPGR